jgi:hypothetical protein
MIQFIGKLTDLKGNPFSDGYVLITLDSDRLDQILYRICECDDQSEDDKDLAETRYFCPFLEVFNPTSKQLRRRVESLMGRGRYAFVYQRLLKVPSKNKLLLDDANMLVVPGAAGFTVTIAGGKTLQVDHLPGGLWESTIDIIQHNEGIENKTKEPESKKRRSYFA